MNSRQHRNRLRLADRIYRFGKMVFPCSRCQESQSECRIVFDSRKCDHCTRIAKPCDAREVTADALDRISMKREELKRQADAALAEEEEAEAEMDLARSRAATSRARWKRLRAQYKMMKKKELDMVRRGVSDLEELDRADEEERQRAEPPTLPLDDVDPPGVNFDDLAAYSEADFAALLSSVQGPEIAEASSSN